MWKIILQEEAISFLKTLDRTRREDILKRLEKLSILPEQQGKSLSGPLKGYRRLRIGKYRAIYKLNPEQKVVTVIAIGHRKDIYRR